MTRLLIEDLIAFAGLVLFAAEMLFLLPIAVELLRP